MSYFEIQSHYQIVICHCLIAVNNSNPNLSKSEQLKLAENFAKEIIRKKP